MGLLDFAVLIIGGAGYIGSHIGWHCAQQGYRVVMLDNLSAVSHCEYPWASCIKGDYGDRVLLEKIFEQENIKAVIHCAAFTQVGDSVLRPTAYYENNVSQFVTLLDVMSKLKEIPYFLFSSSAAVYGAAVRSPISEEDPLLPISPYGRTKVVGEWLLKDCARSHGLRYVAFRYFNVAGAYPEAGLKEEHTPESHLIPLVYKALRQKTPFTIFGTNYPTPDGTCIRDYVHVLDIARAHTLAIEYLQKGGASEIFNIGSGKGVSVLEIVDVAQKIAQSKLIRHDGMARAGDPPALVADCTKAARLLGWLPYMSTLDKLLESAWQASLELNGLKQSVCEQELCTR